SKALRRSSREIVDLARERALAMAPTERPAAVITPIWSLSSSDRCEEAGIATLPKVLISHADTKSAGGVALRVRTQAPPRCRMTDQKKETAPPSLGGISWVFARYANFTLGGGNATTAALHHELLEKRHWLNDDRFALCYALARLTPGTNLL